MKKISRAASSLSSLLHGIDLKMPNVLYVSSMKPRDRSTQYTMNETTPGQSRSSKAHIILLFPFSTRYHENTAHLTRCQFGLNVLSHSAGWYWGELLITYDLNLGGVR